VALKQSRPRMEMTAPPVYLESGFLNQLKSLPVRLNG
jgi:hypothetical protein